MCCIAEKTNLWSCKSTNRGFLKAIFQFRISRRRHLEMWRVWNAVPGPLSLSYIVLDRKPSEKLDLWTYKIKDSFFCHATHLIYVQRAFWTQLVETAGDSFNNFHNGRGHYGEISPRQQPITAHDLTGSDLCHIIIINHKDKTKETIKK